MRKTVLTSISWTSSPWSSLPPNFNACGTFTFQCLNARQERRKELEQSWKDLASRLPSSHLAMQQEDIERRIDKELQVNGTRVLEERIAYLRECLDNGQDLDESWHRPPQSERTHDLNRFQDWKPKLTKLMEQKSLLDIVRDMENRRSSGPISYAHLPQARTGRSDQSHQGLAQPETESWETSPAHGRWKPFCLFWVSNCPALMP